MPTKTNFKADNIRILYLDNPSSPDQKYFPILKSSGLHFEYKTADNPGAFQDLLGSFNPDIVLSRIKVDGCKAEEIMKLIKNSCTDVPIVFICENETEELAINLISKGASDYILEDHPLILSVIIRNAIKNSRLEKEKAIQLKALEERNILLKNIEELGHLGTWQVNHHTQISNWSDQIYEILEYKKSEIVPGLAALLNRVHPDDLEAVRLFTSMEWHRKKKIVKFRFRALMPDGNIKYLRSELKVTYDDHKNPVKLTGFLLDITEQMHAKLDLEKKERFYEALIEKSNDLKILLDKNSIITYTNPSAKNILGYDNAELAGTNARDLVYPADLDTLLGIGDEIKNINGNSKFIQVRIKHKNNSYRWFEGFITNYLHDPDISGIVANLTDITIRKENEIRLIESEIQYKELFEQNPLPMWIADLDQIGFLDVNMAALKQYGYSKEEFLALSPLEIRPVEEKDQFKKDHLKIEILTHLGVRKHLKKNGSLILVDIFANNIVYKGHKARLIICNDITEKLASEQALIQSEANIRTIYENTDTAYILFDKELNIISFNKLSNQFSELILGKKITRGAKLFELLNDKNKKTIKRIVSRVLHGETIQNESKYNSEGKMSGWIFIRYVPIFNKDGKINGMLISINDITRKKLDEYNLKKSEEHLAASQKISNTGSWEMQLSDLKDLNNNNLYYSDQALRIYGLEPDQIHFTRQIYQSHVHPDDLPRIKQLLPTVLKTGAAYESEHRIIRADGQERIVANFGKLIFDPKTGIPVKLIGTVQDITDQKENERRMFQLSEAIDQSPVSIVITDLHGDIIYANPKFTEVCGYSFEEVKGKNPRVLKSGYTSDAEYKNLWETISSGKKWTGELYNKKKNGEFYWESALIAPVVNKSGEIINYLAIKTDITAQKSKDDALRSNEAKLRTLFDNTDIGYVLLSPELKITFFNETAKSGFFLEFGKELKVGENIFDYYNPESIDYFKKLYQDILSGNIAEREVVVQGKDHKNLWYDVIYRPIIDANNNVDSILVKRTNNTFRKNAEIEREKIISDIIRQNKELEQFAYIVSHNLRSPVANILGSTDMLKDNFLAPEDQKILMESLDISVHKLDNVIHDLNYILQVKNPMNEKKEIVYFTNIINDIRLSISDKIRTENAEINCDFADANEIIIVKSYLYSILYNLISNSIKYRRQDVAPVISIISKKIKNTIQIVYTDNGIGMDLEKLHGQLFGLYKRFHFHTEGKGMGLFMVKTQVETMGGSIGVKSEINKGTEFTLTFNID